MEKWYYLEGSIVYGGLTKLASQLVAYTRKRYDRRIASEFALSLILRQIKDEAERLHKANPRCKKPEVRFFDNGGEDYASQIYIDDWFLNCKPAKEVMQ